MEASTKLARWFLALVAVAAIVWLAARRDNGATAAIPANAPANAAPATATLSTAAPVSSERVESSVAPAAPVSSKAAVTVHVIERGSERPVAGASVRVLELAGALETQFASDPRLALSHAENATSATGSSTASDAQGLAHIDVVERPSILVAEKDGWFGVRTFDRTATELSVELELDEALTVRTLDADSRPIGGVPVELRAVGQGFSSPTDVILRATTRDGDGIAEFRHARAAVASRSPSDFVVRADVIAAMPIEASIDLKAWPVRPVDLKLPPLGAVDVRVVDRDAEVPPTPVQLVVRRSHGEQFSSLLIRLQIERAEARTESGVVHFPRVEVGSSLVARTTVRQNQFTHDAAGPARAGELVTITFDASELTTMLHGRLLDASDSPLSDQTLNYSLRVERIGIVNSTRQSSVVLDANGEFRISAPSSKGERVIRSLRFEGPASDANASSVAAELDGDLSPGIRELGDLRLSSEPLIVAGRVVDSDEKPVAGATVELWKPAPDANSASHWLDADRSCTTRSDGSFALRGEFTGQALALAVYAEGFVQDGLLPFAANTSDAIVRLQRGGSVDGTLVFDSGFGPSDFSLSCVSSSSAQDEFGGVHWRTDKASDAHRAGFSFSGLRSGSYRFVVRARGGLTLATIDAVRVEAGKASGDPRLAEIHLRGSMHAIQVRVLDAKGGPVGVAVVRARVGEGESDWTRDISESGRATVLVQRLPFELVVGAAHHRTRVFDAVDADLEVALEDGIPVELALDASSRADWPSNALLEVRLVEGTVTGAANSVDLGERDLPDSNGGAKLRVGEAGRYEACVRVDRRASGAPGAKTFRLTPSTIDVRDSSAPQRFDVSLAPDVRAELEAFLKQ